MKDNYNNILFPYAYNILGSSEEARDAVQDVMYKYLKSGRQAPDNEWGYLVKGVINQSINIKKRKQKLVSDQVWLPEPLATESTENNILREEILTYSLLVLLEKLNPRERAVFILKEAFDYSHREIAEAFECSIENARALLSRARKKLSSHQRTDTVTTSGPISDFLNGYISTIRKGDLKTLEQMLSEDISVAADGGGKVKVVKDLTIGRAAASELLHYVFHTFQSKQRIQVGQLNHQPALLFFKGDRLANCQVFDIQDGLIRHIYAIVDPDKLRTIF